MNRVSTCCICFSPVTCIKEESELVKKRREMLKRISVHQGWRLVVAKDCSLLETPLCVSCEEKLNKMSTAITCKNVPGVSKQYGEIQRMVIDSEILNLKLKKKFQRVATELRNKIIEGTFTIDPNYANLVVYLLINLVQMYSCFHYRLSRKALGKTPQSLS